MRGNRESERERDRDRVREREREAVLRAFVGLGGDEFQGEGSCVTFAGQAPGLPSSGVMERSRGQDHSKNHPRRCCCSAPAVQERH